jgi:hypothetical protein
MIRGTVSLNRACFQRLAAHCEKAGVSMASFVEQLLDPVLEGTEPPPAIDRPVVALPASPGIPRLDRALLDRIAHDRATLRLLHHIVPAVVKSSHVAIDVPPFLAEALADQVIRAGAAGQEISLDDVLDAAINRMLDGMAVEFWCRRCLEAAEICRCKAQAVRGRR